jgi:hypothetical protein
MLELAVPPATWRRVAQLGIETKKSYLLALNIYVSNAHGWG